MKRKRKHLIHFFSRVVITRRQHIKDYKTGLAKAIVIVCIREWGILQTLGRMNITWCLNECSSFVFHILNSSLSLAKLQYWIQFWILCSCLPYLNKGTLRNIIHYQTYFYDFNRIVGWEYGCHFLIIRSSARKFWVDLFPLPFPNRALINSSIFISSQKLFFFL